jgi:hypothetical protein
MKFREMIQGRGARKLLPFIVVVVAIIAVGLGLLGGIGNHPTAAFAFNVYWPSPSSYVPGTLPPTAYLQINYTGSGNGAFAYTITSNSSGRVTTLGQGDALVSSAAPFRDWVFVNLPSNAIVELNVQVYRGSAEPQNLIFTKTIDV